MSLDGRRALTELDALELAPDSAGASTASGTRRLGKGRRSILIASATGIAFLALEISQRAVFGDFSGWLVGDLTLDVSIALVIAVAVGLVPAPTSALRRLAANYGSASIIAAIVFAFATSIMFTSPRPIGPDFYTTTGQVLPVLVVAFVIDLRKQFQGPGRAEQLQFLAVAGLGEVVALGVLAFGLEGNRAFFHAVAGCVFGVLAGLVLSLIAEPPPDRTPDATDPEML